MSSGRQFVPSALGKANTPGALRSWLDNGLNAYKYGYKPVTEYIEEYNNVVEYAKRLRENETRGITLLKIGYEKCLSELAEILGEANVAPYLVVMKPYMTIFFNSLEMNSRFGSAKRSLDSAISSAKTATMTAKSALDRFKLDGKLFLNYKRVCDSYLFRMWLLRDYFTPESIQANPNAAIKELWQLFAAHRELSKSREPIKQLIAIIGHIEQACAVTKAYFAEYRNQLGKLENATGIAPQKLGQIIRHSNDIDYMQETGRGDSLSVRSLNEELRRMEAVASKLLQSWLKAEIKFEQDLARMAIKFG